VSLGCGLWCPAYPTPEAVELSLSTPSVVDIAEHELVAFLHGPMSPWRHIAIPPLTEWPIKVRLQVTPSQLGLPPDVFGDIDALVLSKGDTGTARAVQYKRVKIAASTFFTGEPNKLRDLRKAVHQANALAEVGLAYVWLEVIVVTDAREHAGGRYLVSTPQGLLDRVYEALPIGALHAAAGVVVTEIVQSVDRSIQETGGGGGHMVRPAQLQDQPPSLTAAIAALFK